MAIRDIDVRKAVAIGVILVLAILSFLVIQPILISIITGLLLAYIFNPVYKKVFIVFREKNTAALAVSLLIVLIIFIPLWFLVPLAIKQVFELFSYFQNLDIAGFVRSVIPSTSPQLQIDITTTIISFIGDITTGVLGTLRDLIINLPTILLHLAVVMFVFYFALRDGDKLKKYASELSPFQKEKEKVLIKQFKDITYSIIFGFFIVGIIQGIATGIGLFVFGVPRALLLTVFAIFASIIPIVGPWLIWVPAAIYLFATGNIGLAIGFTLYSVLFVSTIDNLLRPYIVARRTDLSSVIVLIGMIGGILVFGVIGLILGPLILAYLISFLDAYRNKALSSIFNS